MFFASIMITGTDQKIRFFRFKRVTTVLILITYFWKNFRGFLNIKTKDRTKIHFTKRAPNLDYYPSAVVVVHIAPVF